MKEQASAASALAGARPPRAEVTHPLSLVPPGVPREHVVGAGLSGDTGSQNVGDVLRHLHHTPVTVFRRARIEPDRAVGKIKLANLQVQNFALRVMRGDGERAHSEGVLFLTNIQQFYERPDRADEEPDVMTAILGPKPPTQKIEQVDFAERISRRAGRLLVINDEAHHTHDEGSEWNVVIGKLHVKTPMVAQFDFSATPRFSKTGTIFPWTISDHPLKQAIVEGVVKRPVKGIAKIPRTQV
jgi:hypothetical protein